MLRSRLLIPALLLAILPLEAWTEETPGPSAPVDRLEQALLANMQSDRDFDARYAELRPLVQDIMAVERMARYLFGRDWRTFEAGQRDRFAEVFLDLSAATYARQFDRYGGERFDPVEVQQPADDRAVVKRMLTTGSGRKVPFDYLMTGSDDGWQIVTIIADGVSDLALKRSQYQKIVDEDGLAGVIRHIEQQVAKQRGD
ncbi:MAG: ABC transporter substrate-binding protein [Wenzhouxiangellaceae bacterium]|nr:ABC transporter substrate-binding protein [Wenzhouxiangellaceae bacterium]